MKLTDADRKTIWAALENDDWIRPGELVTEAHIIGRVFLAGKRAGREDMRERAANAVRDVLRMWLDRYPYADAIATVKLSHMIDNIRALGVDDD